MRVRIRKVVEQTASVRSFELEVPGGEEFAFKPGQYVGLRLPEPKNRELAGVSRGFSMSSSPLSKGLFEITVLRRGAFTEELFEAPLGSWLEITGPEGSFVYDAKGGEPVFIAGGIGVAPIMSMLRYLRDLQFPAPATLIYSSRSFGHLIFYPELREMCDRYERFRALFTLTRSSPPGWKGETRRVDQGMLEEMIPAPMDKSYYVCGPHDMMLMLTYSLRNMGVKKEQIASELW